MPRSEKKLLPPARSASGPACCGPWPELLLVLAVFFIVGGAPAPHVNETHYLAKAKHYWDPSYCPGDFFLDAADAHLAFYWTVGWLTKWLSLPATAWVGRVAAWTLLAVGWLRLARTVTADRWAAPLAAALWLVLIDRANFAGEWVVGGVEAKCFAYGFVLLGLAAMARGRWQMPWIWFGLASAMHVLVGAWAVVGGLFVWMTESRDRRPPMSKILPGLVVGGLASLPGLLPALSLERGVDPATAIEASRVYVFERLPHHLAPLTLEAPELAQKLARFSLLSAAFILLWHWTRRRLATSDETPEAATAPADSFALERVMRFAAAALAACAVGLLIEAALASRPDTAARVLRYYWFRLADAAVPLATSLAAVSFAAALVRRGNRWGTILACVLALWCGGELLATAVARWQTPVPPAAKKVADNDVDKLEAWRDACQWIAAHTPADAVFLVPRSAQSFKWYASRADVVNWKDVPQDAAGVVQWQQRLQDSFPKVDRFGKSTTLDSPEKLSPERLRVLAKRYGATYAIGAAYPPLDLPVAYSNAAAGKEAFTVYRIDDSEN